MLSHVSGLQNILECSTDGSFVEELPEQEDAGAQPRLGVLVIDLEDPREGSLRDLSDRDVVLPFGKRLPRLLSLKLVEEVLGAHQGGRQEFQLGLLLDRKLVKLLVEALFVDVCILELNIKIVQVLHVLGVALLLALQSLLLVREELLLALRHDHRVLPRLKHSGLPLLRSPRAHALDALTE